MANPREPMPVKRWVTHGPIAVRISSVVVDPQTPGSLYAATFDTRPQVFRSRDSGVTWIDVTGDVLQDPIAVHLSIDPSNAGVVYEWRGACFGSLCYCCFAELRRTVDGGESWITLPAPPGAVGALTVDLANAARLYADFSRYFLPGPPTPIRPGPVHLGMSSADAGVTWNLMDRPPPNGFYSIVQDPSLTTRLYAASFDGVYVSIDSGMNWTLSSRGMEGFPIQSLAAGADGMVYAGTSAGVFRSADGGDTWLPTRLSLVATALVVDPGSSASVFAGTSEGVFRTQDAGEHWGPMNFGLSNLSVTSLAIDVSTGTIHAGTQAGVFEAPLPQTTKSLAPR